MQTLITFTDWLIGGLTWPPRKVIQWIQGTNTSEGVRDLVTLLVTGMYTRFLYWLIKKVF